MSDNSTLTYGMGKKTLKSYIIGLVLSLIFTCISFYIVMNHVFSKSGLYLGVSVLAIAQLIAQVVFFLRMTHKKDGNWNLMPFLFSIVIVSVLVGGSLWIMYNLNYNMVH